MSFLEQWVDAGADFCNLAREHSEWSQKTFGSDAERGPVGPLKHLSSEVEEALSATGDIMEYADCLLLILDASRRAGFSHTQLLKAAIAKLEINKERTWNKQVAASEPVFHVQECDNGRSK